MGKHLSTRLTSTSHTTANGIPSFSSGKAESSDSRISLSQDATVTHDGFNVCFGKAEAQKIPIPPCSAPKWTKHDERRLGALVEKYAIGTLDEKETAEERMLQHRRRMASEVPARSYDEMIRDARRELTLQALLEATENYVKAHEQ